MRLTGPIIGSVCDRRLWSGFLVQVEQIASGLRRTVLIIAGLNAGKLEAENLA